MTQDSKKLILHATPRKEKGKQNQILREKDKIPAITYGSKVKNLPLSLDLKEFLRIYKDAGESTLVDLKIEDEASKKILIQETQFHPITDKPIHVDLYQVRMDKKIKTDIPLKFINESKAVKDLDGILNTVKTEIEVECLPADLISEIEVDIASLETFEDLIYVKDLHVPATINILDDPEEAVVQVEKPRTEEELEALEEKPEEEVEEVEVETKEEKEEAEEETKEAGEREEKEAPKERASQPEASRPLDEKSKEKEAPKGEQKQKGKQQ